MNQHKSKIIPLIYLNNSLTKGEGITEGYIGQRRIILSVKQQTITIAKELAKCVMRIYYIKVSAKLFCLFTGQKEYNSLCRGLMLHISSFYGGSTVHISFYLWSGKCCNKNLETSQKELWLFSDKYSVQLRLL